MSKRRCEDCGEEMELWYMYMEDGYEEWFCNNCDIYEEYKDGELIKKYNLEGVE